MIFLGSENRLEIQSSNLLSKLLVYCFEIGKNILKIILNEDNNYILVIFFDESAQICSFDIDLKNMIWIKEFQKSGIVNGLFVNNGTEVILICWD